MARPIKESLGAAFGELKELLSGAAIRSIANIREMGEVALATIGDSTTDDQKRHVLITFTDVLNGLGDLGRLFVPAGILWRIPLKGEGSHVVRGRKMRGPGAALVMPDGGDGSASAVPGWDDGTNLDGSNAGIKLPEGLHLESTGDRVRIVSNSGGTKAVIEIQKSGAIVITPASGQTVQIAGNAYSLPKLETLLADFATNWNLLVGVLNAGTQGTPVAQTLTGLAAVLAQLQQFGTNLAGATYKSTNAKNG